MNQCYCQSHSIPDWHGSMNGIFKKRLPLFTNSMKDIVNARRKRTIRGKGIIVAKDNRTSCARSSTSALPKERFVSEERERKCRSMQIGHVTHGNVISGRNRTVVAQTGRLHPRGSQIVMCLSYEGTMISIEQ